MFGDEVVPTYLNAIGIFPSFPAGRSPIVDELRTHSDAIRRAATGMRGWVEQIPRDDLPGSCVTIVSAFHNLPDPHVEEEMKAFEGFASRGRWTRRSRQILFLVTQVWQDKGAEPKLIGAGIEVVTAFEKGRDANSASTLRTDEASAKILFDPDRSGRNKIWGGSRRVGAYWVDRSYGLGELSPVSGAYELGDQARLIKPLPSDIHAALRTFVCRY